MALPRFGLDVKTFLRIFKIKKSLVNVFYFAKVFFYFWASTICYLRLFFETVRRKYRELSMYANIYLSTFDIGSFCID